MIAPLDGRTPKYGVYKHDGEPVDPGAKYLVLRIDKRDPAALAALGTYLRSIDETNPSLARHLVDYFGTLGTGYGEPK
jgi:hypothetical protein